MNPVAWIRSRQENRELSYWLSFIAYNQRDRSFSNRLYLVYLFVFFTAWLLMTLTLFASVVSSILKLINPIEPVQAVIFLQVLLLAGWCLRALWNACKQSPLVFSEEDITLLVQSPVSSRQVVLRWLPMPWLKNAAPFWLIAITLGFALGGASLSGNITGMQILRYVESGLHAWVAILPVHLTFYLLVWIIGVYRLQRDSERSWIFWPVIATGLLFFSTLLIVSGSGAFTSLRSLIIFPFMAEFKQANLGLGFLASVLFSSLMLGILYKVSASFSLSRAAQETQEVEAINTALHYGFTSYAQELQNKRRLEKIKPTSHLPMASRAAALFWKDVLQSIRTFRIGALSSWLVILTLMLSFHFSPNIGGRILIVIVWADQVGKVVSMRLRKDLAHWSLSRQLPIPAQKFILADASRATLLGMISSMAGFVVGAFIRGVPISPVILLPGITIIVAGMAIIDLLHHSRSNLLLSGSAPEVTATGILLGSLVGMIPLIIILVLDGFFGLVLATLSSLLLAWLVFSSAGRTFRKLPSE